MTIKKWFLWTTRLNIYVFGLSYIAEQYLTLVCKQTSYHLLQFLNHNSLFFYKLFRAHVLINICRTSLQKYNFRRIIDNLHRNQINNNVPSDFNNAPWLYQFELHEEAGTFPLDKV